MKRDCEDAPIGEDPPKAPRVGPSVDADTQTTGGGYGYPRTIAPVKVNAPPVGSSDVVLSPYAPSAALVPEAMITAAVAAMRDEEDHMDANGYAEAPTMRTDTPDEKPPPPAKEDTPPEPIEVVMEEEAVVMMMGEEETRAAVTHVEPTVAPPEEPPSVMDQNLKEPPEEPDAKTVAPASDGRKTLSKADAIRILGAKPAAPASDAAKPKPLWTVPGLDPHSLWKAIQRDPDRFARDVLKDLERAERTEPYLQVGDQWRREPWEVNPYEQIGPGFVVARDLPEPDASDVVDKLYTTMPEEWTDLPPEIHPGSLIAHTNPATDDVACLKCGKTDGEADFVLCDACPDDDVRGGHWRCLGMPGLPTGDWFCDRCVRDGKGTNGDASVSAGDDTDKQCKDKTVPNGMMAPIIPLHPYVPNAKPNVENRSPLKLGIDLEERPMWGCDCYTRVAIDAALACAAGYKGIDVDARRKRDRFFAKLLMPAVHTMGADGWDLALALEKLKAGDSPRDPYDASEPETTDGASDQSPTSAFERDFETIKEGCDSILRAIREVDEAQLPTVPPPKPAKGSKTKLQEGGGAATFGIKGSKESRNAAAKAAGIKQPMQAFFIFSNEQRAILLESQPELRSNITAVGKMMGDRWKKMSADEKFPYAIKAEEAKLVYEEKAAAAEEEAHAAAKLREEAEMSQLAKERADAEAKKLEAAAALEREIAEAAEKGITLQICGYGKKPRKPNQSSLKSHKRRHFRMHPKGIGIVCVRPGGLPPGTYIQDYLGELYSPWRWYERQDAIKKREPNKELPDFFNITLERPAEDARGHDVLFVEAAHRCTFASRLSHSCAPNCQTVGVAVADQSGSSNGGKQDNEPLTKLSIAQYTTRHIAHGEELCWNYSCVTESEKEYRAAICLCSSTTCKGAFLDYAGSSAFTAVMNTRHNFLDRNALLLRACSEPLTTSDRTRLTAAGIKSCALTMPGERDPQTGGRVEAPAWLIKWAALTLEYVEMEKALLPAALTAKPLDGITYDAGFAAATAAGVVATRVSNLVVTLDKIKYVMRQPGQNRAPFLRPLSDEEIVRHLLGEEGVLPRAADTFAKKVGVKHGLTFFGGKGSRREAAGGEAKMPAGVGQKEGDVLRFILDALARYSKDSSMTPAAAAQTTEACSAKIRSLGETHFAMADCLLLYARTKHWCTPEQYNGFQSPPVQLVPLPKDKLQKKEAAVVESIGTHENGAADDETTVPLTETPETETAPAPPDETAAGDKKGQLSGRKLPTVFRGNIDNVMKKKYQPHFAWGQLVSWFKQTIYDPSASLSAERRGTMSLPDPESAYSAKNYVTGDRKSMLNQLGRDPSKMWPTTWAWSFRNPSKVYGSPFIDDAIRVAKGEERTVPALLEELRQGANKTEGGGLVPQKGGKKKRKK